MGKQNNYSRYTWSACHILINSYILAILCILVALTTLKILVHLPSIYDYIFFPVSKNLADFLVTRKCSINWANSIIQHSILIFQLHDQHFCNFNNYLHIYSYLFIFYNWFYYKHFLAVEKKCFLMTARIIWLNHINNLQPLREIVLLASKDTGLLPNCSQSNTDALKILCNFQSVCMRLMRNLMNFMFRLVSHSQDISLYVWKYSKTPQKSKTRSIFNSKHFG
jgi:hypothetical protein